jgi:O-methyltransferase
MKKPFYVKDNFELYLSEWERRSHSYEFNHSLIFPKNTYSPWLEDNFSNFYNNEVKSYTLVDIYRCFELDQLCQQLKNVSGDILEVGVWRGGTAKILERNLGKNDKLYLCDTFTGVVKAGELDKIYKGGEHADTSIENVTKMFSSNENVIILQGIFPEDTADKICSSTIKFCHIDVDVYQSAKDIYDWVLPRLSIGGIVVFDDYGFAACEGITRLVNSIEHDKVRVLYNLNGHAVLVKISN